jgi:hypothetical protein
LIVDARSELDRLFSVVRRAHYAVLLCDHHSVVIEHRGDEALSDQFKFWGQWLGGVWSEEVEGTNGIGTCIAEKRPVTVHQIDTRGRYSNIRNSACKTASAFGQYSHGITRYSGTRIAKI